VAEVGDPGRRRRRNSDCEYKTFVAAVVLADDVSLQINGGGGVGSAAIQLARKVLKLPVVIATASRDETIKSCKKMGATHVINHREDLVKQVAELNLDVPIK